MRGYDIDGVLTRGVVPIHPYVVISGRLLNEWDRTIAEIGSSHPIYLRPSGKFGDQMAAANWKARMINAIGVTIFYEDDPVQIAIIRAACPGCRIELVA